MTSASQTADYYLRFLSLATTVALIVMVFTANLTPEWLWLVLAGVSAVSVILSLSMFVRLIVLTVLWSTALAVSGGAENAANALQLLLIAAAFLVLPQTRAWIIFTLVMLVQLTFITVLLAEHSQHAMHGGQSHYLGMSLSFAVAACLLALAISKVQRSLLKQHARVQQMREDQLRQEQILAMGTASAQITHELATPLATLVLSYDELAGEQPTHPLVREFARPLTQVKELLASLRTVAEQIQHQRGHLFTIAGLEKQLRLQVSLHFGQARVDWQLSGSESELMADLTLIPAILGLIRNALSYSSAEQIAVRSQCDGQIWTLHIENEVSPLTQERLQALKKLGYKAVKSDQGLGVGVLLSHATLERFSGSLRITANDDRLFIQSVQLPLQSASTTTMDT